MWGKGWHSCPIAADDNNPSTFIILTPQAEWSRGTTGEPRSGTHRMATVLAVKIPSNCLPSKHCFTHQRPMEKNSQALLKKTSCTKATNSQVLTRPATGRPAAGKNWLQEEPSHNHEMNAAPNTSSPPTWTTLKAQVMTMCQNKISQAGFS